MDIDNLTDDQLNEIGRRIADQRRERECATWDAELVGRFFRIIRAPESGGHFEMSPPKLPQENYVTLEESLAVGGDNRYVYADIVYLHIERRDDFRLKCSGFEVSHANRQEPYLKIQPVFYSIHDFRGYLRSWSARSGGPTKHFDEIPKDEYDRALRQAVNNFTTVAG